MRTITLNIYKFEELSAPAQKVAIRNHQHIEVDLIDWSYPIIEDAALTSHIKITEFDLPYNLRSKFITDARTSAQSIISEMPTDSPLYSIASKFLSEQESLERSQFTSAARLDMERNEGLYQTKLEKYYLKTLDQHYDYLTSDEGVQEYLRDSDFEFTADGARYYDKK